MKKSIEEKNRKLDFLNALRRKGLSVCTIKYAQEFLKDFPDEFKALIMLGTALTEVDRQHEAVKFIDEAIQIATPNQKYQALATMAFIYYNMGSFSIAETWYNKALSIKPLIAIDVVFMADCLIKTGKFSEAIHLLKQSINTQTNPDIDAYFHLGVAYRAEEKYEVALEYFKKTVEIDDIYIAANDAIEDIEEMFRLENTD